ncbi:MAG: molybdenum cofactor guanylyltransferase [Planctomycetes bacterium]|nr:molybdenum cofactor guanylyltransferase [Planctomycetota bacterium]
MVDKSSNPPAEVPPSDESQHPLVAGVLIGGGSRRMGQTKASLPLGDSTFLGRIVAVVRQRSERVVLLGAGTTPPLPTDVVQVPDVPGLTGPLAGILAALRWMPQATWIIAACDLPRLRVEALDWLLGERRPERWAVLPRITPERIEPLLAVYEPESRRLLEEIAASGQRSLRPLAGQPRVFSPTPPQPLRECWTNVNTPAELRQLEPDADLI